jgi:hypothetical protein
MNKEMQNWASKYFQIQAPAITGPITPQNSLGYLKKVVAMYMTPRATQGADSTPNTGAAPATDSTTTAAAPAGADSNTTAAAPAGADSKPAAAPATPAGADSKPAAAPAKTVNPAHAMFKDPAAFKAEWDKFMGANPNFKLITNPELLSVLKNMWMRTGGTKLESKNNKGTRV